MLISAKLLEFRFCNVWQFLVRYFAAKSTAILNMNAYDNQPHGLGLGGRETQTVVESAIPVVVEKFSPMTLHLANSLSQSVTADGMPNS